MMITWRIAQLWGSLSRLGAVAALAGGLAACADSDAMFVDVVKPDPQILAQTTPQDARKTLSMLPSHAQLYPTDPCLVTLCYDDDFPYPVHYMLKNALVTPHAVLLQTTEVNRGAENGHPRMFTIRLDRIAPVLFVKSYSNGTRPVIALYGRKESQSFLLNTDDQAYANQALAALLVLKDATAMAASPEEKARFDAVVQTYRAASPKPALPEDARRFEVQAEDAVRDKQFAEAEDLYAQELDIVPWLPKAHFNRALVLAEIGDYGSAKDEMGRYLALAPDAQNARQAQDYIYQWERKEKEAAQ